LLASCSAAALHDKIKGSRDPNCFNVVKRVEQTFSVVHDQKMLSQFASCTSVTQLPEVSGLWWLHAKNEQSLVLFVLQNLRLISNWGTGGFLGGKCARGEITLLIH
jgi:hypothetical protein